MLTTFTINGRIRTDKTIEEMAEEIGQLIYF